MPSYYSIVRYVPDPVTDERLNIGIVVYGEGKVLSRFLGNWGKARIFGGEDIRFLREFAEEIELRQLNLFTTEGRWDERTLQTISSHWKNSIQLSEPKASLKSPDELLLDVSSRYVREQTHRPRQHKDKREVVRLGLKAFSQSYLHRYHLPLPDEYIKRRHLVTGARDKHSFDLVVGNGRPFFAAEALSFQGEYSQEMRKEVDAALWVIEDVRKADKNLPLAVLALPPSGKMPLYNTVRRIFKNEFGADFVTDVQVASWGRKMAKVIQPEGDLALRGRRPL
jgi:hypothetical protein